MKVQPVASPHALQPTQGGNSAQAARDKAIAAFTKGTNTTQQGDQSPVQNQNQVSPEELSAIKAPSQRQQSDPNVALSAEETAPTTEEPQKPQQDPEVTRKFEQLARQEKSLRAKQMQQEKTMAAREAAIAAKEQELAAKANVVPQGYYSKDQIKQNILSVMAETGVSYDEVVQQLLNQTPVDPRTDAQISALKAEIQALKNGQEKAQKSYEDQQTQSYQAALRQIETDVKALVANDKSYETIKVARAEKDVVELIEQTYREEGRLLTNEEAAQEVEDYLINEALKFTQLDKIKHRLAQKTSASEAKPQQTQDTKPQTQPMKTLTNAASSSRPLSAKERAILAFKGELKS